MKKSTLLISAAMLALSTNIKAQTLTADTLQLQNPSFEEFEGDDAATGNHAKGWQTEGATPWTGKSQKSMPANTKGAWYVRAIQIAGSIEPVNRIYQTVAGKGPGVYVLSASVNVSRNVQRGDIDAVGKGKMFGYLYVMDEDDIDGAASKGYRKIGECFAEMKRVNIIYPATTGSSMELGFGLPAESQGLPKGWLQCDDFVLTFFPGATETQVEEYLNTSTGISNMKPTDKTAHHATYTLSGMQVKKAPAKGVYIRDGKKFVVK